MRESMEFDQYKGTTAGDFPAYSYISHFASFFAKKTDFKNFKEP